MWNRPTIVIAFKTFFVLWLNKIAFLLLVWNGITNINILYDNWNFRNKHLTLYVLQYHDFSFSVIFKSHITNICGYFKHSITKNVLQKLRWHLCKYLIVVFASFRHSNYKFYEILWDLKRIRYMRYCCLRQSLEQRNDQINK